MTRVSMKKPATCIAALVMSWTILAKPMMWTWMPSFSYFARSFSR